MTKDLPHYSLLCDEQLPYGLVREFSKRRHKVVHVKDVGGLKGKTDNDVIDYAEAHNYCVVTRDNDFKKDDNLINRARTKKVSVIILKSSVGSVEDFLNVFIKQRRKLPRELHNIYCMSIDGYRRLGKSY